MVLVKPCLKLEKEILAPAGVPENGLVAGYWPAGAAVLDAGGAAAAAAASVASSRAARAVEKSGAQVYLLN